MAFCTFLSMWTFTICTLVASNVKIFRYTIVFTIIFMYIHWPITIFFIKCPTKFRSPFTYTIDVIKNILWITSTLTAMLKNVFITLTSYRLAFLITWFSKSIMIPWTIRTIMIHKFLVLFTSYLFTLFSIFIKNFIFLAFDTFTILNFIVLTTF